jgi:molybdenum cofactor cytidylyltransferase
VTAVLPCGLLLAAGLGTRFRRQLTNPSPHDDKLMQRLPDGRLVAVASAQTLLAVLPKVVAVVRPGADELAEALGGCGAQVIITVANDNHPPGMGDNLAVGARATLAARGWVVALADMPWIGADTVRRVAMAVSEDEHAIATPVFQGQRGHPVAFGTLYGAALSALTGDQGARELLRAHAGQVRAIEVDDAGVLADIDTPEDLAPHGGRPSG